MILAASSVTMRGLWKLLSWAIGSSSRGDEEEEEEEDFQSEEEEEDEDFKSEEEDEDEDFKSEEEDEDEDFKSEEEDEDEDFKSEEEDEDELSSASSAATTFKGDSDSITSFSSTVSSVQDGAAVEEFEDSYSPAESQSENSTNSHFLSRKKRSGGSSRTHLATDSFSDLDEPEAPLQQQQQFHNFHLSHPFATARHREIAPKSQNYTNSQSYANSRNLRSLNFLSADGALEQIQGRMSKTKGSTRQKASFYSTDLKQIQLRKLENVIALDKDWDVLFPDVREVLSVWPWPTLIEEQVALGQLNFNKFLVVLNCLGELPYKPEEVLSIDQITHIKNMKLEEVAEYVCHEVAIFKDIPRNEFPVINRAWLKQNEPISFECNVDRCGNYKLKIVKQKQVSTLLHRTFGEDRVMPVYFDERPTDHARSKIIQDGILVGLRRYRFWTFKDSGKDDFKDRNKPEGIHPQEVSLRKKTLVFTALLSSQTAVFHIPKSPTIFTFGHTDIHAKDYDRAVKCYFVCTESLADIDLEDPSFKFFTRIHAARCHIMHIHTVPIMAKFASRLQLALSKSTTADIDLTNANIEIKMIEDVLCKTLDDSGKPMSHTDGTGEISEDVAKLLPVSVFKGKVNNKEGYPTLVQIRMFFRGEAFKGTLQVNQKLKGLKIYYRESMKKISADRVLQDFSTVNSLEILNTSRKPKEANLSHDLIILLSVGKVPPSFFIELVQKALDNVQNMFTKWELAFKEVENCLQGVGEQTYRMLNAGFPINHPQVQKNLRMLTQDRIPDIRKGCVPLPGSFYLMGTSDPTENKVLKRNQVAIAMGEGKISGKVLVYKNPGKHRGDVHVFDAIWDSQLDPYIGASQYTIFFSVLGDRPVVDEMANSDLDGDLYWVCNNEKLLSYFIPSAPWKRSVKRPDYAQADRDRPGNLTPEQLEQALFQKFLDVRFQTFRTMQNAAKYWLAHMDQFLMTNKYLDSPDETSPLLKKIDQLTDIFYSALDADKNGEKVELPPKLRPVLWPHFMEKKANTKKTEFYKSTSVLGQIYDMADISTNNLGYSHQETMEYDRNFEFEGFEKYIDKWRGLLQRYNKEMNGASKGRQNEILVKFQKILMGIRKPLSQVLEEASAVYVVNHEHALFNMERGYPPSLHFAMTIALPQLCDIYSRNVAEGGAAPYSSAPSVRNKLLRHS